MARIHLNRFSVAETEQFLSEKALVREGLTIVTLTSGITFAAKNLTIYSQKDMLR